MFTVQEELELTLPEIVFLKAAKDGDPVFLLNGVKARVWRVRASSHTAGSYRLLAGPEINCSFESLEDLVAALKKLLGHG